MKIMLQNSPISIVCELQHVTVYIFNSWFSYELKREIRNFKGVCRIFQFSIPCRFLKLTLLFSKKHV